MGESPILTGNGGPTHVVVNIGHGDMEQLVVAGAGANHGDGVHARAAEDNVLVLGQEVREQGQGTEQGAGTGG